MEVVGGNTLLPGDPRLIDHIVCELKSQGIFDQFRKECIADVDTKPAYQNLRQRVEGSVTGFLKTQNWRPDMNKNQLREMLRKNIYESGFLETGVERIVDQVVNPKINTVFLPQVEEVVYKFLGLAKPIRNSTYPSNGPLSINTVDLLPTDLDPISPDSEVLDKSLNKTDKIYEVETANLDDSKNDEFESPPFEPITEQTVFEPHDESSNDSRISGISGLTSHDSNMSDGVVEKTNTFIPDVNNQDSQLSKVSSNSRLSIVTTDSKHTPEKMDISDDTEDSISKIEEFTNLTETENNIIVKEETRDELEEIRMEINGHNQNKDATTTAVVQEIVKTEIKEEISNNDVKMIVDVKTETSITLCENEEITVKDETKEEVLIKNEPEKQEIKIEDTSKSSEISKTESKKTESKSDRHRHDSEKRKDKHTDNKDRKDEKKSDKDRKDKDKYKSSSSSSAKDKERHREKSRDSKSSKDKDSKSRDDRDRSKDNKSKDDKDKSKSSSSTSKHSSRDRNRTSSKSESKSSKDSRDHSKSKDKSKEELKIKSDLKKDDESKSRKSDSSKSRSRDHSKSESSKHSSSHSSKDRKSSSNSSNKDYREKKDGKKSSKREQDDHSSSRDKKSDSRRSADRDSNDGSSGVNNGTNSTKEKDNSTSTSTKSKSDNSDFSGSNSGDSGQSDNFQNIQESNHCSPLKVDITQNEIALNPVTNLSQMMKLKKPKIASNIFEVRKLMKIRKKMEKLEKKRQRQQELASENKDMRSNTQSPNSVDDTDSVDSECLVNGPQNIDELVKNIATITGEEIPKDEINTTAIVSKESWDAIEAKLSQSAYENVDFNLYAEDTGDSSSNSKLDDSSTNKRSKRMSEEEDCLYFSNEVSPTTERFLQSIETFKKNSLLDSSISPIKKSDKSKRSKILNNLHNESELMIYSDVSPKKKIIKGKKRKLDGDIEKIDSENNNKKINAIVEINDVLDTLTASPSGSNLSNGSIELPTKPKKSKTKKTKRNTIANYSPNSDIDSENLSETKKENAPVKNVRASIFKSQRYSSDDLYKPRPVVSGSSRRQRGLLNNTDKKN